MVSTINGRKKLAGTAQLPQIAALESRVAELTAREKKYKQFERLMTTECAVSEILARSATSSHAVVGILQAICECIGWGLGEFWSVDFKSNLLYCKEIWHNPSIKADRFKQLSKQYVFAPGIGLPGRLLSSGKPNWIIDVVKDDNFPRALIAAEEGLHSACGFPIFSGSRIVGAMGFFCNDIQEPDEEMLRCMARIGGKIADFNWNNWHDSFWASVH